MIYFHYCEAYKQNIPHQADKLIQKKLNEYKLRSNLKGINAIASYTAQVFILNVVNPHFKVILEEKRLVILDEEVLVYFVRDIANMGQNFAWSQIYVEVRDGKWSENNPLSDGEITEFEREYLRNTLERNNKLEPPSALTQWHKDYKLRVEYDVYESEDWVKFALSNSPSDGMKDDEAKLFRLTLTQLFTKVTSHAQYDVLMENSNGIVGSVVYNDIGIVYSMLFFEKNPVYLLHGGANVKSQKEHWFQLLEKVKNSNLDFKSIENIQRAAARAYPHWALNNSEIWKAIQKSQETGNLSLLPEQTHFLKNFTFPKYINGQAGSGKSTMLYYLFANAYFYKCYGEILGDIIFLTENEELIKFTRKSVVDLLQSNPEFELSSEDIANVDDHFASFKSFLLKKIPEENKHLFPVEKYLDFSRFKILYDASNIPGHIKRRYSAELVWFAITTYILGYDLDLQINSQNFEDIMPAESRNVLTGDVLKGIEKEALPFYKKLVEDNGYWDKIKIIKFIKSNVEITDKYEIIFCDEAQDFSRVELRFILSLSDYIQYDLSTTDQVPIVFAGDALQTVNPTGFRSAEIKDMLYQELKEVSGFNLDTNNIEYAPTFNYRSSREIVNIANSIQYYRKKNFGADIKRPQIAKRIDEKSHLNVFLDYDAIKDDADLKKKLEYKIFIIPANSDEKENYIDQNPFLNNFTNIKTAVEAKGIDYEQVVIYGFGDYYLNRASKDEYEKIFFFNKLYVAVTRAQFELVIIDIKESEEEFWQDIINFYSLSTWAEGSEVPIDEIKETILFGANQIPYILQSTPEMALVNAQKDKEKAIYNKNPSLLRIAANQFLRLGDKKENFICLALMSKLQHKWREAATYYLNKEVGPDGIAFAADTYWEGKLLAEFLSLTENRQSNNLEIKRVLASLMTAISVSHSDIRILWVNRIELRRILSEISWRGDVISTLVIIMHNAVEDEEIKYLIDIFEEIAINNDKEVWKEIGEKNYLLHRYEEAIKIFDKINDDGITFIRCHIELCQKKDNIIELLFWLGRLAKETSNLSEKISAEKRILLEYKARGESLEFKDRYISYMYLFNSFILHEYNYPGLDLIAKDIEGKLQAAGKIKELVENYKELLISKRLDRMITQLILLRWVKNACKLRDLSYINSEYKKVSALKGIQYIPFTDEEIDQVSELPSFKMPALPSHLEALKINNFRRFKNVEIEGLSLFNLVVGDNNVGKTTFLESLLISEGTEVYLGRLAFAYIDRKNVQPEKEENSENVKTYFKLDKSFLSDYKNYDNEYLNIQYQIEKGRFTWSFLVSTSEEFESKHSKSSVTDIIFRDRLFNPNFQIDFLDGIKQPYMSYGRGFGIDLAQVYYSEVALKPKVESDFIQRMKFFIPTISRIIPDTRTGAIDVFDTLNPDEYRPLHHYGEGANKLFRIMLMLVLHRGHRVLIDEVDAGIHFSRFPSFWRTILEISKRDKTQIIMTTHNDECIKFFSQIVETLGEGYSNYSRIVQLKNVGVDLKIRSYRFEDFNSAINDNLELRGGINI